MKKVLFGLLLVLLFPLMVFAKENKLVKVYIFEAGGCPYCEAEIDYLKGLSSYKKKFTIVQKELYVDHVNWAQGKDYELGVKVANTFKAAGFTGADYYGTPFVVISDLYAATSYSTDLEEVINNAYKQGDKDIVSCIASGKEECIKGVTAEDVQKVAEEAANPQGSDSATDTVGTTSTYSGASTADIVATIIICTVVLLAVYLIKSNKDKNEILDKIRR